MASVSSLSAPGVEVREYDQSLRITSNTGTTVFVPGFAAQGPVEEVISISSITDFENIYGIPTNAAERYFYYTVLAILNNSGAGTTVLTSRLAYGNNEGDNVANDYTMLVYPAVPVTKNNSNKKGYEYYSFGFEGDLSTEEGEDTDEKNLKEIFTLKDSEKSISPVSVNCEFIPVSSKRNTKISIVSLNPGVVSLDSINKYYYCLPTLNASYYKDNQKYALKEEEKPTIDYKIDNVSKSSTATILVENDSTSYKVTIISQIRDKDNVHCGNIKCVATYNLDSLKSFFADATVNPTCMFAKSAEEVSLCEHFNEVYSVADSFNAGERDSDITYIVGAPATYNVSLDEYYTIVAGEYFKWSDTPNDFKDSDATDSFGGDMKTALSNAAFITINTSRAIVNDSYEGYYLGMTDNLFNEPSDDYTFNSIKDIKFTNWNRQGTSNSGIIDALQNGKNEFVRISNARLDFLLDSDNKGSISNVLQTSINAFDTSSEEYDDTVNMAIFKLAKSTTGSESMKLTYSVVEKFNAAFGKTRTHSVSTAVKPQNYFVESIVASSKNMTIMVNPYISSRINIDINGILHGKVRFLSDKLVNNYKYYESKYLNSNVTEKFANDPDLTKVVKLANSNIQNWSTLVDRIGAPISLLEEMTASDDYALFTPSNALYPFATYTIAKAANKYIGNVPSKITRALDLISNDEEYPDIDILVEGGLGTIYAYANAKELISEGSDSILIASEDDKSTNRTFVEDAILQGIEDLRTARTSITEDAEDVVQSYLAVQNAFQTVANSFQNGGRGDTFYVADILRGILIRGANTKVEKLYGTKLTNEAYGEDSSVKHSWSTSIYSPIKHLIENFTTSYASVYAQWVKIDDGFTNERYWVPVSGYMTALMCAADQLQGPWYAAAGLNRGIVNGVVDCAINPNQKQRGDLYKICVNSVPKLANIGITNWGIRTLSKKASAFDQNTCRRTFLFIEKAIKKLLRYYLFEPNNAFTQLSIYNEIQPYMESIRNQGGIYSFSVVCNSTNNTSEIVNAGNLVVDVSAAPTRTAEFIVLNMTANKYDSSVSTSEFGS